MYNMSLCFNNVKFGRGCGLILTLHVHMAAFAAQLEKEALQNIVLKCFSTILSSNQRQRKDAEEELRALEVTDGSNVNCLCS